MISPIASRLHLRGHCAPALAVVLALLPVSCTTPESDAGNNRGPADPIALLRAAQSRLESTGGSENLGGLIIHASGRLHQSAELQGRRPGVEDTSLFREAIALLPDGRVGHEFEQHRVDGTREWVREVYAGGAKTIHILEDGFSVRLTDGPEVSGAERIRRRFPHALLAEALAAVTSDEQVLSAAAGDEVGLAVRYRLASGGPLTLELSGSDTTLRSVTYSATLPGLGDATVRWTFGDYRRVTDLGLFPHTYGVAIGEATFLSMVVDSVTVDDHAANAFVAAPDGFDPPFDVPPSGGDASAQARVEKQAEGVFVVRNLRTGFHPMFVEFQNFVVAVDAPAGYPIMIELPAGDVAPGPGPDWLARRYIELIREAIPDKPIRFVILTHFHNDHAGGMRAFVAEGTTVLAAAGDEEAVRAYYRAPHNGAQDVLRENPAPLNLEVVTGRRVISDGQRTLEVLPTGPNPHTDDMLVVNLPDDDILFVSDLMNTLPADDPALGFFLEWLVENDVDPARIFTMHGAGAVERSGWRQAYERMRGGR